MKVLVIGATGATGRHAVANLLARGDTVTAFVRTPSAFVDAGAARVVEGEARDAASLERATAGADAVLSAFGPRSLARDDLQEVFMRNLVAAMTKSAVKRLVNLSAWGVGDSRAGAPFLGRLLGATLLRHLFADKERGETILLASALDYVNVRPGRLTNGGRRGGVKASIDGRGIVPVLARGDLADFMVEQLRSDAWVRTSPIIGY